MGQEAVIFSEILIFAGVHQCIIPADTFCQGRRIHLDLMCQFFNGIGFPCHSLLDTGFETVINLRQGHSIRNASLGTISIPSGDGSEAVFLQIIHLRLRIDRIIVWARFKGWPGIFPDRQGEQAEHGFVSEPVPLPVNT